jgi:hypothetical protein
MAARNRTWTPEIVRQRIKTSMLVNRLTDHAAGQCEMSASQITAALGLLRKSLPDLLGVAHTGSIEMTKPEELTDVALANIASGSRNRAIEAPDSEEEPSELH